MSRRPQGAPSGDLRRSAFIAILDDLIKPAYPFFNRAFIFSPLSVRLIHMTIESDIKQKALELGFDAVGITTAVPVESKQVEYFQQWLEKGNAAGMGYLHRNIDKRFDPAKLLTGAKSVICVVLNYRLAKEELNEKQNIRVANFAQYEDYHPFIKERLFQLADYISSMNDARCSVIPASEPGSSATPSGCRVKPGMTSRETDQIKFKACVDSVPLAERALARRAGLGFIGKNHMLIHPELGNQILLGELITTLQLEADEALEDLSCGDCGKCIRACPTGALGHDGSFDSRKCISYLTIEAPLRSSPPFEGGVAEGRGGCTRDPLPPSGYSPLAGGEFLNNHIFGCDECILACPHEINRPSRKNTDFQFHPEWKKLTPEQIQNMTEDKFQKTFANSGFIRLGLERLKRNCKSSGVGS